eukprot:2147437-Rhodomonas_salina.1
MSEQMHGWMSGIVEQITYLHAIISGVRPSSSRASNCHYPSFSAHSSTFTHSEITAIDQAVPLSSNMACSQG